MNIRIPLLMRQCALVAGSVMAASATIAAPIGYATLNGGTTGGAGGQVVYASTGSEINQAMCNRASDDTPLIIYVDGTINHGNTAKFSGSCDTQPDEIQFKGVSNISLIGVGSSAVFDQIGIHLRDTSNIILQNLHIKNVKKSGSPTSNGGDAIGMESGVFNVWVDHCTLEASGGEDDGYDSLLDMKATTQYVTVSYTHYNDSGRGGLMGSSDSDDTNTFVTFHHNYYQNVESRMPLLRHGTAHSFNNYYNGILKSGMNPRMGGKIKAEHNHFENANNPIGTFYTSNMGYWDLKDNIFENVTWTSASDEFPAGPNPVSTTSISIPYAYTLDDVNCVRDIVKATAGAGKGLATSDGSCSVDPGQPGSSSSSSSVVSSTPSSSSSSSTPGAPQTVRYEGESAYLYRGVVDNIHSGYSGSGFADYENVSDSYAEWNVNVPSAGQATATFRFANGTTASRPMTISVNGNVVSNSLAFNGTGGWASWNTQSITLTLNAGNNVIRAASASSTGGPNVDYLEITTAGSVSSSSSSVVVSSSSSSVTPPPQPEPGVLGNNIAAGAGADGSSKGNGTSYGSVSDGNLSSFWSPSSNSGQRISVKGLSGSFNTVIIRELNNATTSWRLVNNDNGAVLASGSSLGGERIISGFGSISAGKINLMIDSANSAPQIAEFEVYNATGSIGSSSSANSSSSSVASSSSSVVSSVSSSSSSVPVSSSSSSAVSSSSSSIDYSGPISNECINLATNPNVNWRDSSLQSDQEIVACLSQTLGQPVGYGENARGGFDPNGNSKLTVITKNSSQSVEAQILAAISDDEHNWIVFDKFDFAQPTEVAMYRTYCGDSTVQSILGATEAQCINYTQWCSSKGFSNQATCLSEFFNKAMNKSNIPIRIPAIGSNKTLDGRMSEAFFRFSGFAIGRDSSGQPTQTSNSVILTHLNFVGAGHTEDHYVDPDMIRATGASHDIWIHRNNFDTTGDAAFDVKVGAYDITISFNKVVDVLRASLHGSSDSRTINEQITTTMHHNAFITRDSSYLSLGNTGRRVPLIRRGTSHMFNNLFVNYRKDVLSIRVGASVLWEDNAFVVNESLAEKSSIAASLSELQSNMARDVDGGNFRADDVYIWFFNGACNLNNATQTPITDSSGSVRNLTQDYSSASQSKINSWRIDAGQDLVDYVSATAGRDGQLPFNSPLAGDMYYVLGMGEVPCQ